MIASTDWVGIATVVVALGTTIPAILAAVWARGAQAQTATPDNLPSIGNIAATNAVTLNHVHDVVCNGRHEAEPHS